MKLNPTQLAALSATEAHTRMVAGEFPAHDYAAALLARIDAVDASVQAWAHLDREHVLAQAARTDQARSRGEPCGP